MGWCGGLEYGLVWWVGVWIGVVGWSVDWCGGLECRMVWWVGVWIGVVGWSVG